MTAPDPDAALREIRALLQAQQSTLDTLVDEVGTLRELVRMALDWQGRPPPKERP